MSALYLYAIVAPGPAAPLGSGLANEALTLVASGDVVAVVGEMREAPVVTAEAVRGHDAVVRRLAERSQAILPARFGTLRDAAGLAEWMADAAEVLGDGLGLVAGREQMTLHVFDGDADAVAGERPVAIEGVDDPGLGPGARYLVERRSRWRQQERLPELEPLRPRLDALVAAERVERRTTPPWRASVYHLIDRGRGPEYRAIVEANLDLVAGVRVRVSGPWAPYAFAVTA